MVKFKDEHKNDYKKDYKNDRKNYKNDYINNYINNNKYEYKDEQLPRELLQQEMRLKLIGESHRSMPVPDSIDSYITRGIQNGKRRQHTTRKRRYSGFTAAAFLIIFLLGIRVSPAFAAAVSQIPGMDYIVHLVRFDKGLQLAVENDFIQSIGVSDEHNGVRLTVDGLIADEHRMVILYNLHSTEDAGLKITDVKVSDAESGDTMSFVHYQPGNLQGSIEVKIGEGEQIPDRIKVEAGVSIYPLASPDGLPIAPQQSVQLPDRWANSYPQPDGVWSVEFDVDHEEFRGMQQIYDLDETVTVAGQNLTIKRAIVHPIGVSVEIEIDPSNRLEIFSINELRLVNENGERYDYYAASYDEYYFESPYFAMPEELYLIGEGIRAWNKEDLEVEIDLNDHVIVRAPDERLELHEVIEHGEEIELVFRLWQPEDDPHLYHIFNSVRDKDGHEYPVIRSWSSKPSDAAYSEITIAVTMPEDVNKLLLDLVDYPANIEAPFRVRIK